MHQRMLLPFSLLILGLTALDSPAQPADPRVVFVIDDDNRVIRFRAGRTWEEWKGDMPERAFRERERTGEYIELATDAPQPARVRLYARKIYWRLESEVNWREGKTGRWRRN